MHKADQKFSQWCKENGFGDLHRNDKSAAMWLAEHWSVVQHRDAPAGLTHPRRIKEWCKEKGFGDMERRLRADAMWWAENAAVLRSAENDLTHPTQLRKWFNEQKQTALLPADLSDIPAESIESIELDERSAERIAKVIHRPPAGAGYMKGTPSPWSPRGNTSFIQGVEAQSHYTPGTGEPATVTPRGDPSKVCGEKFSRTTS